MCNSEILFPSPAVWQFIEIKSPPLKKKIYIKKKTKITVLKVEARKLDIEGYFL